MHIAVWPYSKWLLLSPDFIQARPIQNAQSHEVGSEPVYSGPIKVPGLCSSFIHRRYLHHHREQGGFQHRLEERFRQMNRSIAEFPILPAILCSQPWELHHCNIGEQVQRMQSCAAAIAQDVTSISHRLENLGMGTNNGEYIWKIPNVHRQYRDAVERNKCIFSPPFYTGPHGYKMCMRAYLNGDGIGKGTHVSLFFSIMRSNHDDFLCWPFKQLVHLSLSTKTASITKVFKPDPTSPSFQKPTVDMIIASGCPKFACQSILHNRSFIHDDVIRVKCQVDLAGL